jgi:hypothetical protein
MAEWCTPRDLDPFAGDSDSRYARVLSGAALARSLAGASVVRGVARSPVRLLGAGTSHSTAAPSRAVSQRQTPEEQRDHRGGRPPTRRSDGCLATLAGVGCASAALTRTRTVGEIESAWLVESRRANECGAAPSNEDISAHMDAVLMRTSSSSLSLSLAPSQCGIVASLPFLRTARRHHEHQQDYRALLPVRR